MKHFLHTAYVCKCMNCTHFQHALDCGQFSDLLTSRGVGADAITETDKRTCLPANPCQSVVTPLLKGSKSGCAFDFLVVHEPLSTTLPCVYHINQKSTLCAYVNTLQSSA